MKEAKKSAAQRIKQLKRQKMLWFYENAQDQGDYIRLLRAQEYQELQIEKAQAELDEIRAEMAAKAQEMVGQNKTQLEKYDQLIREAEETYNNI